MDISEDIVEHCVWVYFHGLRTGKLLLKWSETQWSSYWQGYSTTLQKESDLVEINLNGFGGPGWSRYLDKSHKKEE